MNTDGMTTRDVERKGIEWAVSELFPMWQKPGTHVLDTATCRQKEFAQRTFGDYMLVTKSGETVSFEVKTERRHTGNVFLESWSNLTHDNTYRRDGWLFTLRADVYVNIFLDLEVAYVFPLPDLKRWALEDGNAYRYPERPAGMSTSGAQKNKTVGFVVPLRAMLTEENGSKPAMVTKYVRTGGTWSHVALIAAA